MKHIALITSAILSIQGISQIKTSDITINENRISVIDQTVLTTKTGTYRFIYGTSDTTMIDCPNNFTMIIEDLGNQSRIFNKTWGVASTETEFNIHSKPKYIKGLSFGEKIYVHLGTSGCGSGYSFTTFELAGLHSKNVKLKQIFQWSETSRIVYETNSGRIFVLKGLWEPGCHFGCETKYEIGVYSITSGVKLKKYTTKNKYPDVTNTISDEELLQIIKKREKL